MNNRVITKKIKLTMSSLLILLLIIFTPGIVFASPYESYVYTTKKAAVKIPNPYSFSVLYEGRDLGTGDLKEPNDIFVDAKNNIYVSDSGNNRILVLNSDFKVKKIISGFKNNINGEIKDEKFNYPSGLFVSKKGSLYIADTKNSRIVELDESGNLVKIIAKPDSQAIRSDFAFYPTKIAVDKAERVYVVGPGIYEGIVEFESDGRFVQFTGSNKVKPNIIEYFWTRIFATDAQKSQTALFLPEEYTSLDIDEQGFLYTASVKSYLKRMNAKGDDITKKIKSLEPIGDYLQLDDSEQQDEYGSKEVQINALSYSRFIDIAVENSGTYTALDISMNRLFTYDFEGNMLWAFGTAADQKGAFKEPIAVEYLDNNILVLDKSLGRINVFILSEYGCQVIKGVVNKYLGDNETAALAWSEVLKLNAGSELAYTGLGKVQLSKKQYKAAMNSFKLAQNRTYYSKAYKEYRRDKIRNILPPVASILIILLIVWYIFRKIKPVTEIELECRRIERYGQATEKTLKNQLLYGFHVIIHPFDGFWDLKREGRGSLGAASIFISLYIITMVIKRQATGFLFNKNDLSKLDIFYEVRIVLLMILLWSAANWALTTLFNGEGSFKDILVMSGYALLPIILTIIPGVILSNILTLQEGEFINIITNGGFIWSLFLFFIGTMVTHQYTLKKNVITIFATFAVIGFILFIGLVSFQMFEWVINFVTTVFKEIYYRV